MRRDVQRAPGAWRARTFRGFSRAGACLWVLLLGGQTLACAPALRGYDVAPNGLARSDERLRRIIAAGHADSALIRLQPSKTSFAPTDPVLRLLYQGTIAYYAGEFEASVAAFDSAAWLADDRTVMQLSREAAALLSSDRALPYRPSRTERLFNAYYAALAYLRMNDPVEAAVEARRIGFILESTRDDLDAREAPLYGVFRYMSGVLYELAGDRGNAEVAYRNAAALNSALTPPARLSGDSGDVVLFIEDGFVAHRVQHSLTVVVGDDEHDRLHHRDRSVRYRTADDVAARVLASAFGPADEYGVGPRTGQREWFVPAPKRPRRPHCRERKFTADVDTLAAPSVSDSAKTGRYTAPKENRKSECEDEDRTYVLRMAWAAYHADRLPAATARVLVGPDADAIEPPVASVNDAVLAQYERDRPEMLARTIARSATKYALVKGAEDIGGDDDNGLGRLLGAIANVSTAVLEQADTRSWTLLPGGISVARIRLPAGTHDLKVTIDDRTVDLKAVDVKRGAVRVETVRAW